MRIIEKQEIDTQEPLWRYFKTDRFLDLLRTGHLYFASARQFDDPFEGAVAVLPPGLPVDPRYASKDYVDSAFEELKRLTKISCWHRANYESDAMWQLYSGSKKGIAIRTNAMRIRAAARPYRLKEHYGEEVLWAGNIFYVDLLKERLNTSMLDRFWYKHMAFSWEREFRLGISLRSAEEAGVDVPDGGVLVEVDVPTLIERIFLGPSLAEEDTALVREAAAVHSLGDRISVSSMLGTPRYA